MCDPLSLTAASFALSAASAGGGYLQSKANAKATEAYQKQTFEVNKSLADANAVRAYAALQRRAIEENAMASKSVQNVVDQARQAQGAARTASGEAGTSGNSVDQVYQDFARQEAEYTGTIIRQRVFNTAQLEAEGKAIQLGQQAQIQNAVPQPIEQPNFLGALLRIGEAGTQAYTNYYLLTQDKTK